MDTTTTTYEIITPDPFHHDGEFAGTPAGEWVVISNKRFDTVDHAVAAIAQLMEQQTETLNLRAYGTLAIRHVGYPEIDEFYTVEFRAEPGALFGYVEATRVSASSTQ